MKQAICDIGGRLVGVIGGDEIMKDIPTMPEPTQEADQYVRDHLLIEFMLQYVELEHSYIEEFYEEWINWLKRMEEQNGQRSTV